MTKLGCRLPNAGPSASRMGEIAQLAEELGVHVLHLADHLVLPGSNESRYPFTADGHFPFDVDSDWYEVMTACTWVAAHTSTIELGTSVLVLPQRHPLELAKVAASVSRLSGGRLFLGVGAGWLREEFSALGRDFGERGRALDEGLAILRSVEDGRPEAFDGEVWQVPEDLRCYPALGRLPLLIGGMSPRALRRAARFDGWIAHVGASDDRRELETMVETLADERRRHGATGDFRKVAKMAHVSEATTDPGGVVAEVARLGFDEVVIYPSWDDSNASATLIEECLAALGTQDVGAPVVAR